MLNDQRLQIYADRLLAEWEQHGKPIISVDFDSTISPYHTITNTDDIERAIALLRQCIITGCYLIMHTSCDEKRHDEIRKYCQSIGLNFHTINETPLDLPYGKKGSKPYANIYLDDRAALPPTLDILEWALYQYRGRRMKDLTLGEHA